MITTTLTSTDRCWEMQAGVDYDGLEPVLKFVVIPVIPLIGPLDAAPSVVFVVEGTDRRELGVILGLAP